MIMEEDLDLKEREYRWSWPKFWIGWAKLLMDKALWVWILFTVIAIGIIKNKDEVNIITIITVSGWVGVTLIYLLGDHFKRGFEKMLANSKIETSFGLSKKVEITK